MGLRPDGSGRVCMGPGQSWTVPGRHPDFKKMRLQKKAKKQKSVSDGSRQAVFSALWPEISAIWTVFRTPPMSSEKKRV